MKLIVNDVKHLKLKETLLWLGLSTGFTVFVWVSYSVYAALNKPTFTDEIIELSQPIDPTLNKAALDSLEQRFNPPDAFTVVEAPGVSPTVRVSTSSGRIATQSGNLP